MKIKRLQILNFMPYKGEQEITFPMHDSQNVMLLYGDNMRGKTSFLNSIRWCFYGVALARHLRKILRVNLVNSDAAKEDDWQMSVSISFVNESKEYEVKRLIRKRDNVISPNADADFEEELAMKINGNPILSANYNYEINQVIPEEISRFFLFDGELLQEYENLLIDDSDQGKKIKTHIEQALGVPALSNARQELGGLLKDARALQSKDAKKDKELQAHAENQKNLQYQLETLEKDKDSHTKKLNEHLDAIDKIEDDLKNTEAVQRAKSMIDKLSSDKKREEDNIEQLNESNRHLLTTAWKDVLARSLSSKITELKAERDNCQSLFNERQKLTLEIDQLNQSLSDSANCSMCGQKIPEENLSEIKERINLLKSKLNDSSATMEDVADLISKIDHLSSIKSNAECERIIENLNKVRSSKIKLVGIDNDLEELNVEIQGHDTEDIMRQRDRKQQLEKAIGRIESQLEEIDEAIEENNKKQEQISNIILMNQGSKNVLSSKRVELYQNLQLIFKESIDELRDDLRSQVESHATSAFKQLTTEKDYSGLEINENYGLSILDAGGNVLKERSAGAEQIVALALIDGLNRTARKSGPIIMDTPLGRLDLKHRFNVLNYLPEMGEQIVLLVHEGELNPNTDLLEIAERVGANYQITRISGTQSRIEKVI